MTAIAQLGDIVGAEVRATYDDINMKKFIEYDGPLPPLSAAEKARLERDAHALGNLPVEAMTSYCHELNPDGTPLFMYG